jgi:hypothetical protein
MRLGVLTGEAYVYTRERLIASKPPFAADRIPLTIFFNQYALME